MHLYRTLAKTHQLHQPIKLYFILIHLNRKLVMAYKYQFVSENPTSTTSIKYHSMYSLRTPFSVLH